jgi:hypothetical protein
MVVMLAVAQLPATALPTATLQQRMNTTASSLQTGEVLNNDNSKARSKSAVDTTKSGVTRSKLDARAPSLTVANAIRPPSAVDDAEATPSGTPFIIRVLRNDSDPQNLPLKVVAISPPTNGGTVTFDDSTVFYAPALGFAGIDTFTYTISNGVLTNTAFVDAIVLPPPGRIWEDDSFDALVLGSLSGRTAG